MGEKRTQRINVRVRSCQPRRYRGAGIRPALFSADYFPVFGLVATHHQVFKCALDNAANSGDRAARHRAMPHLIFQTKFPMHEQVVIAGVRCAQLRFACAFMQSSGITWRLLSSRVPLLSASQL